VCPCARRLLPAAPLKSPWKSSDGLAIIDLDCPFNPPRRLRSHGLPWLVVDVQWSPFAARDYWVVSTANHRALVWNLNMRDDGGPGGAVEHSLQGHSRAITDINFSAHHPDILATCAVDGYVHSWDLRRPRQPALSFCDWFAGATQVKYNRQNQHLLASCHDRLLHIWDERRAAEPLRSISAHASKIYGLDWNRTNATDLVTCSLDRTIKFWDYTADSGSVAPAPERIIRTEFPVWRARHTPFGTGLLAMPQNEPGDLYLYDYSVAGPTANAAVEPVAVFEGHGAHKAREFLWRSRGEVEGGIDNREFQLVSWGEDKHLRLQCLDRNTLERVGYKKGGPAVKTLNLTRKGAPYKTFRAIDDSAGRDRRTATMSDPRTGGISATVVQQSSNIGAGPPGPHRLSALSAGMRSGHPGAGPNAISWRGPSMRARTSSTRRETDRSRLQIGWMKGITMIKRSAKARMGDDDGGVFSPTYGGDDHQWGEPDTIQEEVVRIDRSLPKVKWENVDMDAMTMTASLHGPWGHGGETIFLQVRIDVPASYPKQDAPRFAVEPTSFMPEETHKLISGELNDLAQQFLERKQNCLEMAFKYLLGEVDLEASTSFFKNVRDLEDHEGGAVSADESSSEESDSEMPPGGSAAMSQELPPLAMGGDAEADAAAAAAAAALAANPPPPPMLCGARFAPNGMLVCFFPTKEEKARLAQPEPDEAAAAAAAAAAERSRDEPVFAGFGRLAQEGGYRHHRYDDTSDSEEESGESEDDDGDESSSSSSSSSDSDSTSMRKISLWHQPGRRIRKAWSENRSMRSSDAGTGAGTGTGTGTAGRRKPVRTRNAVALHDMRHLLPSREEFAHEYAIFGDGAEVCKHNAGVAARHGADELADVWTYLALLLRQGIPLEMVDHDSVLVVARRVRAVGEALVGDSAAAAAAASSSVAPLCGRVKWGAHPLAKEFVNDLFCHYEQLADVQMLAMLSCIFSESPPDEESVLIAAQNLTQPVTPMPLKAPSFSLEYFPADASVWTRDGSMAMSGRATANTSAVTTPRTVHTPLHAPSGSHTSDDGIWLGEAAVSGSFSCGETPPPRLVGRDIIASGGGSDPLTDATIRGGGSGGPSHSQAGALLSSSADAKLFRLNPNFASAFGANFPRHLSEMLSSSPPGMSRRRPSPAEGALTQNLTPPPPLPPPPQVTWNMVGSGSSPSTRRTAGTSVSSAAYDAASDTLAASATVMLVPYKVSVMMEDQTQFDDDGWMTAPILDPGYAELYPLWRHAYAEMLQMWREPLARLEVLKFCVLGGQASSIVHHSQGAAVAAPGFETPSVFTVTESAPHPSPATVLVGLGSGVDDDAVAAARAAIKSGRGLDVTGICFRHGVQLDPHAHPHPASFRAATGAAADDGSIDRGGGVPGIRVDAGNGPGSTPTPAGGGAVGSCRRCRKVQTQLRCVYCLEPIDALYVACLACGCVYHDACLSEWHHAGETLCPAGDDCDCVVDASNDQVESWAGALFDADGGGGGRRTSAADVCARAATPEKTAREARRSFGVASLLGKTANLVLLGSGGGGEAGGESGADDGGEGASEPAASGSSRRPPNHPRLEKTAFDSAIADRDSPSSATTPSARSRADSIAAGSERSMLRQGALQARTAAVAASRGYGQSAAAVAAAAASGVSVSDRGDKAGPSPGSSGGKGVQGQSLAPASAGGNAGGGAGTTATGGDDSPARLSLGNRLRKAGNWSRAHGLRRGGSDTGSGAGAGQGQGGAGRPPPSPL
jgi:hypothetical protein